MKGFLKKIFEVKKKEIKLAKKSERDFLKAVSKKGRINLIAELKFASPSKGKICDSKRLNEITKAYNKYASAISVVTEKKFFKGNISYLKKVKQKTNLPILRKDFILDESQIYESKYFEADAILLIASILPKKKLREFISLAEKLGMHALVEVHNARELKKALNAKAKIIGINNRNLKTMKIDLNTTKKILSRIPKKRLKGIVIVSESGITGFKDIITLPKEVNTILVGTSLMTSNSLETKLRELTNKPLVKICALTNKQDSLNALKAGADLIGFLVEVTSSKNNLSLTETKKVIHSLPSNAETVVLTDAVNAKKVIRFSKTLKPKYIQLLAEIPLNEIKKLKKQIPEQKLMKSIYVNSMNDLRNAKKYESFVEFILLDSGNKKTFGGTGKTHNHNLSKKFVLNLNKPVFLAGGLNAKNVFGAIKKVKPFGVDVSSGVSLKPRKKSMKKMKEFIGVVRNRNKKN
ncbi:MAG: hypothetical protein ABIA76_04265 [Candidatus Diapherotrites archaeon]